MASIGIDYTAAIQQAAGIGRYVRELINALLLLDKTNQYHLFAASQSPLPDLSHLPHRVKRLPLHDKWLMRVWHRARLPVPVEILLGRLDLFHSPDFTLPPTLPGVKTLLTVHDLSFVRDPDSADNRLRAYLEKVVPRSVHRADHVLADSKATRQDLIDIWDTPPTKITVIYCGVEPHFRPVTDSAELQRVRARDYLGEGPYLLSVGTLHPRKNYRRLIQAFEPLARQHPDLSLVIAGGRGWGYEPVLLEPARLGIEKQVHFPGFVADEDLPTLYSAAEIFVYPSLYEGFGIPILEAMACGLPVIASNRSSLPEVTGTAGLQMDPLDVAGWTTSMFRLRADSRLRSALSERGRSQASRFSWSQSAVQLLAVYQRLLQA